MGDPTRTAVAVAKRHPRMTGQRPPVSRAPIVAAGYREFEMSRVLWFGPIDRADLPADAPPVEMTRRAIAAAGRDIAVSGGVTDPKGLSDREILRGDGLSVDHVRPSIETAADCLSSAIEPREGEPHPFFKRAFADTSIRDA